MILADFEIKDLAERGMVTPFDETLLNPASLDIRLGAALLVEQDDEYDLIGANIKTCTRRKPFWLQPGQFVLAHTVETFEIPDDICGQFALKSTLARAGFEHLLAGWIDPGWHGSSLTLELKNARERQAIPMWPGMRIGQIVFMRMSQRPEVSYRECGRYNGDKLVTGAKDFR